MNQTIINLLLALATNELLHNGLEINNMREKLRRLSAYMNKKSYKELPVNIDTRAKSYTVSFIAFAVFVLPLWGAFTLLNLDQTFALKLIVCLLIASYIVTAVVADQWHVDIEKITKPFRKK